MKTTAEVVTLEASVRVLQVGNRQITQSVVRQLDFCPPWELEPMGRVKLKDGMAAIGRHVDSGELRLASAHMCERHGFLADGVAKVWTAAFSRFVFKYEKHGSYHPEVEKWFVDPKDVTPPRKCPCCIGCSYLYLTCTADSTPWPPSELEPRETHNSGTRFWTWRDQKVEAVDGVRMTTQGRTHVLGEFQHTGTGNRFDFEWINELPLIVLARLR